MNRGLATRLARLEKRLTTRRPLRRIVFGIYPDEPQGELEGMEGGGVRVMRAAGEALDAFRTRALAEIPSRIVVSLLGPSPAPAAAPPAPRTAPTMWAPQPGPDPFALAGIGRRASRAELEQMGALWVPPERLI